MHPLILIRVFVVLMKNHLHSWLSKMRPVKNLNASAQTEWIFAGHTCPKLYVIWGCCYTCIVGCNTFQTRLSQQAHNVETTSIQRWINVNTAKKRWLDVVSSLNRRYFDAVYPLGSTSSFESSVQKNVELCEHAQSLYLELSFVCWDGYYVARRRKGSWPRVWMDTAWYY